jgi:CubicO group peptidase (beta-lactamase class C family)
MASIQRREFLFHAGCAAFATSSFALVTAARESSSFHSRIVELEQRIPELLTEFRVPGLSIAIISDARISWRRGFGVEDAKTGTPVGNATIFEAQSMSKPVFAYRVMKLCEQGIIDLDRPLTTYTTEKLLEGDALLDLITARRVLCHTTGLPNWRTANTPLRIDFTPGEKWSYSGEGYNYLQSIVTRRAGHTDSTNCRTLADGYRACAGDFGDDMTANLLRPFGMASSGYVWTETIGKKMARPHDENGMPLPTRKSTAIDVARYGSAGSLLSTATDFAKFLIEIINPRPSDNYRLNARSHREMLRPQVDLRPGDFLGDGRSLRSSWSLGWQVLHLDNGDVHCHGGDYDGFHSMSAMSLPRQSGFVVMSNGENGYKMIQSRLMKYLLDRFVS